MTNTKEACERVCYSPIQTQRRNVKTCRIRVTPSELRGAVSKVSAVRQRQSIQIRLQERHCLCAQSGCRYGHYRHLRLLQSQTFIGHEEEEAIPLNWSA